MKKIVLILALTLVSLRNYAAANCNCEATKVVAQMNGGVAIDYQVLGSIREDLMFYTFVADSENESLVFEVKSNADSYCITEGYYEHYFYSDEFEASKIEELSIFRKDQNRY